ncbi:phosphatidylserine decarboxylase family protein [Arthrobacter sp. MMS18-M83]|uniref:phosphatidylserine decarboxylase family protein n=1 Tax=Arthrobacter sp. MMS18-M83 TaxID=2996261 RepID=UPI00227D6B73|nr:phosphatidylserine decarboxylase family protein [Arthrobacter sp. MMS18-M83]WAH98121.1 phosphatidylserine decarboxylase family protein [Arthrobacter sp. MMS18-M83]
MTINASSDRVRRLGGWLPERQDDLEEWIAGHRERAEARGEDALLHPVIVEFKELIASDPVVRLYMTEMIEQVPTSKPYRKRHLTSVDQMLLLINEVLTTAPEFSEGGMVTTPLTAILDWTMGTKAGFAAHRDPRIVAMFRKILDAWCVFLTSEDSLYVLNDSPSGWMSQKARQVVGMDDYQHDALAEHWGFTSWNDFFARRLTSTSRPVAAPEDDKVIVSACESTPYKISSHVQRQSRFWVKNQPYSLDDLLARDESVDHFVGGTVYQAFLSALNYHRWHAPVAGTIVRAYLKDGTYFSEAESEGANAVEATLSQSYLAHLAARAIILIQADDPVIGLMAVIPVGMVEVSSCVIAPEIVPGHHVNKGDDLGCFQFGGSTECLVFRPGVIDQFALTAIPQPQDPNAPLVRVRSKLATVRSEENA